MDLQEESLQYVLGGLGPAGLSGLGVLSCTIIELQIHDLVRQRARNDEAKFHKRPEPEGFLREWYFMFTLQDNTRVFLKPEWNKNKIAAMKIGPEEGMPECLYEPQGPRGGPGGTEGPGTVKKFKSSHRCGEVLRFRTPVNS